MKKGTLLLIVEAVVLIACHKNQLNPVTRLSQPIVGKWNVDTLTTYFYDSGRLLQMDVHVYPVGAPDYPYRFQFNNDLSWTESFHSPGDPDYVAANGTYSFNSDTTFILMYVAAAAGKQVEPCKIISVTDTSFVFSKELRTFFNGTDPGYIKYVFQLTRL